jgi:hypothetical protein
MQRDFTTDGALDQVTAAKSRALLTARDQPRRRCVEDSEGVFDLRRERRNACPARGFLGAGERCLCCLGDRELMYGTRRRRHSCRFASKSAIAVMSAARPLFPPLLGRCRQRWRNLAALLAEDRIAEPAGHVVSQLADDGRQRIAYRVRPTNVAEYRAYLCDLDMAHRDCTGWLGM